MNVRKAFTRRMTWCLLQSYSNYVCHAQRSNTCLKMTFQYSLGRLDGSLCSHAADHLVAQITDSYFDLRFS